MNASRNSTPISILIQHMATWANGDFIREQIDPVVGAINCDYYEEVSDARDKLAKKLSPKKLTQLLEYEALLAAESHSCENAAFSQGMKYAFYLAGMAPKPEGVECE